MSANVSDGNDSAHDRWCPSLLEKGLPDRFGMMERATCRCDLIARVREDERMQVIGSVSLAAIGEANMQQYREGYSAALRDAAEKET